MADDALFPLDDCALSVTVSKTDAGVQLTLCVPRHSASEPEKRCTACGQRKPLSEFSVKSNLPGGYNTRCRDCVNKVETFRRWGTTYDALQEIYGAVCNICGREEVAKDPRTGRVMRLAIDHDHRCCDSQSGCVKCIRGLLCAACNYKLGVMEARPEWFHNAQSYLDRCTSEEVT